MPRKQRITPALGIDPTTGRSGAVTRDTFQPRTGEGASAPLRDLARSLSRFGEQAGQLAPILREQQQTKQAEEGRQAFLAALEDQKDTAKAIASLELRPQQSKWFRFGVQAAAGKTDAMRARDHFFASQAEALEDATTLEEFDALASKALDEHRGDQKTSEAFDNGFFPSYTGMIANARYEFARGLDGKLGKSRLLDYELSNLGEMKTQLGAGVDRGELAQVLTAQLDDMQESENPLLYSSMQEIIVQNLKALSYSMDDQSIIELAKSIKIGPAFGADGARATLWDRFRGGSDGLESAIDSQLSTQNLRRNTEEAERVAAEQEQIREITQTVASILTGDDVTRTPELMDLIETAEGINFSEGQNLRALIVSREAWTDNTVMASYESLQTDIWSGRGSVIAILNSRDDLSKPDTRALISDLNAYEASLRAGTAENSMLTDGRVTPYITELGLKFGEGLSDFTDDKGNRLSSARAQLRREIALNAEELSQMSDLDLSNWLASHQDTAAAAFKSDLQVTLEQEGEGFEGTPIRTGQRVISSQGELEQAFSVQFDLDVSRWAKTYGLTFEDNIGDVALRQFKQRWNAMRPDAPVGSSAFLNEWTFFKQRRDGTVPTLTIGGGE